MKKSIFLILLVFILSISAHAQDDYQVLNALESSLFGYEIKNETNLQRIERLEEYMYGGKKTGSLKPRLEALQNDSGIAVQAEKPKQQTQLKNSLSDSITGGRNKQQSEAAPRAELKEDATAGYPAVDKMEQNLFNQTYQKEDIYSRLDRLEKAVFQKTSSADLSTRVSRLSELLSPKQKKQAYSYNLDDTPPAGAGIGALDDTAVPFQLALLENGILKRDYSGNNNAERLARLEQNLFSRTFPNDSDLQRVQRLTAAYEAKKNSRMYENNKRMQNMAALSQIGGILLMILAILL